MNNLPFLFFIIFSAFTMNLVLQCGLGINTEIKNPGTKPVLIRLGIMFFTIIVLWILFRGMLNLASGIFIHVLLFPSAYIAYEGLEYLVFKYSLNKDPKRDSQVSFPGGITAAALFICIIIANNFFEAFILSFGFSFGILVVFLIISEIKERADMESVPRFLRGKPLVLISMGLLSLVFTQVSLLLFRMIVN